MAILEKCIDRLYIQFFSFVDFFFHELLEEITRRLLIVAGAIFENNNLETLVNFGGSEQCGHTEAGGQLQGLDRHK